MSSSSSSSSPSVRLSSLCRALWDPSSSYERKEEALSEIRSSWLEGDHVECGGGSFVELDGRRGSEIRLPPVDAHRHLRKGYTMLVWWRPGAPPDAEETKEKPVDDDDDDDVVLYRISRGDAGGVVATLSDPRHDAEAKTTRYRVRVRAWGHDGGGGVHHHNDGGPPTSTPVHDRVPSELVLSTERYSLLTISHTHPYLKRPQIIVAVDHEIRVQFHLAYPFGSGNVHQRQSRDNLLKSASEHGGNDRNGGPSHRGRPQRRDVANGSVDHPHNSSLLHHNVLLRRVRCRVAVVGLYREALLRERDDAVLVAALADAGPSAARHALGSAVLVPAVPPRRDATVSSDANGGRGGRDSDDERRRPLGAPLATSARSVETQNWSARSRVWLWDFSDAEITGGPGPSGRRPRRISVRPCAPRSVGVMDNSIWVTHPVDRSRRDEAAVPASDDNAHAASLVLDGDHATYRPSPFDARGSADTLLHSVGVLPSLLLPFHLAHHPVPEEERFYGATIGAPPLQPTLREDRRAHARHLARHDRRYAANLLRAGALLLRRSWFCREEALQTGWVHAAATLANRLPSGPGDETVERALRDVLEACCGPVADAPPSDAAAAAVLGLALHRHNHERGRRRGNACLAFVVERYATPRRRAHEEFLRRHLSVRTLLDQTRTLPDDVGDEERRSLTALLAALLRASHATTSGRDDDDDDDPIVRRGEADVRVCVRALVPGGGVVPRLVTDAARRLRRDPTTRRRLARSLRRSDLLRVVAPVSLSRTVGDGDETKRRRTEEDDRADWRALLDLWVWVHATTTSSPDDEAGVRSFGRLLAVSASTGSLHGCLDGETVRRLLEGDYDEDDDDEEEGEEGAAAADDDDEEFRRWEEINRVRILIPLLPGLVACLVTPPFTGHGIDDDDEHHRKTSTFKQNVVPILTALIGGVSASLRRQTEDVATSNLQRALAATTTHAASFFGAKHDHRSSSSAYLLPPPPVLTTHHLVDYVPRFLVVVELLAGHEAEHHTDWIDVDADGADRDADVGAAVDRALDCLSTLLLAAVRGGAAPAVAVLNASRPLGGARLSRVLSGALDRCARGAWSDASCKGVARVCWFLEEHPDDAEWEDPRLSCSLVDLLRLGREESGWHQTSAHATTTMATEAPSEALASAGSFADDDGAATTDAPSSPLPSSSSDRAGGSHRVFLPILQPTLRILLRSVVEIDSDAVVPDTDQPLLEHVCREIDLSVAAALVGLSFTNARDVGLGCVASLRASLRDRDDVVLTRLFCRVARGLRERYVVERRARHAAQYAAYGEGPGRDRETGEGSRFVENVLLAGESPSDPVGGEREDFIMYPDALSPTTQQSNRVGEITGAVLGWSKYAGLGSALEECCGSWTDDDDDDDDDDRHKARAETVLEWLGRFLDEWDSAVEMEEEDLVRLFDELDPDASFDSADEVRDADANGDAAVRYIETLSSERRRLEEVEKVFASLVERCEASALSLCWRHWAQEVAPDDPRFTEEWDRSGGERTGRETYSHFGTCWVAPQFPKFVPEYLDHSVTSNSSVSKHTEPSSSKPRQASLTPEDIAEFNLGGKVEIVDITKKVVSGDPLEDSDEEGSLGFPELKLEDSVDADDDHDHDEDATRDSSFSKTDAVKTKHTLSSAPYGSVSTHAKAELSTFSHPPDTTLLHETSISSGNLIETYWDNVLHVRPEGSRKAALLVTKTHVIVEYYNELYEGEIMAMEEARDRLAKDRDSDRDATAADDDAGRLSVPINTLLRPNSIRFLLTEVTHAYLRRYRLRDSAMELFFLASGGSSCFSASNSLFVDFGAGPEGNSRRDAAATYIMRCAPQNSLRQFPERSGRFLYDQLHRLTLAWVQGSVSNFDYLMHLNVLSGRSFNDLCQYPVVPWVLSNYHTEEVPDLTDPSNFRDLTKPMGALNEKRLAEFIERFETFADPSIPPFMYGSHYSTSAGVVLHFLVRMHPFAGLHRQLQNGHFDVADRLFCNVQRTWESCTGASAAEVKELIPEWYCDPTFLRNSSNFKLGTSQDGQVISDVQLPPWANNSPEKFVEIMRSAMESDICSSMLPDWIDLIFGFKQQGPESIRANNVFFYLTYYGSVDISAIPDEALRVATELQIAHFGQCPMQLFWRPHIRKLPTSSLRRRDSLSNYLMLWRQNNLQQRPKLFKDRPISHWVHLAPPPPGPHGDMVCVRICFGNRCVGVDEKGVLHFFKWAWKPDEEEYGNERGAGSDSDASPQVVDKGCFVAQRELSHFRSLPRLPLQDQSHHPITAIAISQEFYLSRAHLLVLSDGDGCGGLSLQFVDPKKGVVKTETIIPYVHGLRLSAISMDTIATPSGKNARGPSGEVAIVGSEDGTATLWRFIFNSYIPLRPRIRMKGHNGNKICSVAVSCRMNLCVTTSKKKCCLFHLGNGLLMRSIMPPTLGDKKSNGEVQFADTQALCLSILGFIVCVCEQRNTPKKVEYSLQLFTMEGHHCGSYVLDHFRGKPRKMTAIAEGKMVVVCNGRGATFHKISAIEPLEEIEEMRITHEEITPQSRSPLSRKIPAVCDVDFYPRGRKTVGGPPYSGNRPIVAVAGCTDGAFRLHALPGITQWSVENQVNSVTAAVGNALAKPAHTIKNAVGSVKGLGSRVIGFGKEIGREVGGAISYNSAVSATVAAGGSIVAAGGSFVGGILRGKEGKK